MSKRQSTAKTLYDAPAASSVDVVVGMAAEHTSLLSSAEEYAPVRTTALEYGRSNATLGEYVDGLEAILYPILGRSAREVL